MKTAVYGVLGAVLVCSLALFLLLRNPVLLSLGSDVRNDQGFQVLNPFRSRQPEKPAVALLERLKAGECIAALGRFDSNREGVASICGKERDHPITGWRLEALGYDRGRALFRYRVGRTINGRRWPDPVWIWVSKRSAASWEVAAYEAWY